MFSNAKFMTAHQNPSGVFDRFSVVISFLIPDIKKNKLCQKTSTFGIKIKLMF